MTFFPNLRFPEFEGTWKFVNLGNCAHSFEYGMNASAIKFDGENRYIRITDIDENSSKYKPEFPVSPNGQLLDKYLVSENDILFARTGASTGKSYLYDKEDGKLYFAGFLIKAKIKEEFNSYFVFTQTKTIQYFKWVQLMSMRSGQPGINSQEYASYSFNIPSKNEQDKIASFLLLMDERILTQRKIIEQLETLMRANREKLFSQKLKFKDQNGNEFPKWEIKEFNSVLESVPTKKFQIKSSEICEKGKYKVVDQGQYYVAGYSNNEINLFKDFPVIIFGDHTTILKYIDFEFIVGADGTKILKAKNNDYLNYLFHNLIFRNVESEGYKRHFTILSDIYMDIPCLEEQVKIANFLSSIQKKIDTERHILGKLDVQKKFLLANLFV